MKCQSLISGTNKKNILTCPSMLRPASVGQWDAVLTGDQEFGV